MSQGDDFVQIEATRVKGNPEGYIQAATDRNYTFQLAFYLNAYPETDEKDREFAFRNVYLNFQKFDKDQWAAEGKDPRDYLEVGSVTLEWAHKFFETVEAPLTQLEFKKVFKEIDVTKDNRLSLLEYLMYRYKKSIQDIAARPQVANPAIAQAQAQVDAANAAIDAFTAKMAVLEEKVATLTGVKKSMAQNEIDQNKNEDLLNKKYNADLAHAEKALRTAIAKKIPGASGQAWVAARIETNKVVPLKATGKV
jgi:phage gp36-like protein